MEKIEETTRCAADQIREILNRLEKKNRVVVLVSFVKEDEVEEVRPAGITQSMLNNSEITWRRHLRGYRYLPRY